MFPFLKSKKSKNQNTIILTQPPSYNFDGLITYHDASFMHESSFKQAYQRGIQAAGEDYRCYWRVHVALWAASQAIHLEGDFVECGVNRGFISSCIMRYLNWNNLKKSFYLFDTFCGLDASKLTEEEMGLNYMEGSKKGYKECFEEAKQNFSEFKNTHLIRGSVPDTLSDVSISKVAYLSIDMNCAKPEIAAAHHFWAKLSPGALIVLDDYAYKGFTTQKKAFDEFAKEKNLQILALPTGQGLIIKSS
jgi:hypothetical protein